jgi:hypothetical protein
MAPEAGAIHLIKLCNIEPHNYLADVITRIVNGHSQQPDQRPAALGLYRLRWIPGKWPEKTAYG